MAVRSRDRRISNTTAKALRSVPLLRKTVGILDQLISSFTNVIAAILAARALGTRDLGTYAICASLVTIALGLSRVTASDPLVLTQSAEPTDQQRTALRSSLSCTMLVSLGSGCVVTSVALLLGQRGFLTWLPVVLLPFVGAQDCLRFFWIMTGDQARALRSDLLWLCLLVLGQAMDFPQQTSASALLVLWIGSGAIAGLVGLRRHVPGGFSAAVNWLRLQRSIVWPQLGQFAVGMGTGFLMVPLVASVASVAEAGEFRLAQILASPYNVVAQGVTMVFLPHLVRAYALNPDALVKVAARMSLLLSLCATANLVLVAVLPSSLLRSLLGGNWNGSTSASLLLAAQSIPVAIGAGATTAVLAARWMIASLKLKSLVAIFTLIFSCAGAWFAGAAGAAVGLMVASSIATPLWWLLLVRSARGGRSGPTEARCA